MNPLESDFAKVLKKEKSTSIPIYCPGYPETEFIKNYLSLYKLNGEPSNLLLKENNYGIIKNLGFDAISVWDFRRGKGGYNINESTRVDGWGRIYKNNWYSWEGVFKNIKTINNWEHLTLPSKESLMELKKTLPKLNKELNIVFSLPGLFEKTWQSMGFIYFSKCLRKNNLSFIKTVVRFYSRYMMKLISVLEKAGVKYFLIADDFGYKNRSFIPKPIWKDLFFNEYNKIVNLIHNSNNFIIIHSDGYISDLIDTFIEIGFDGIQSLEPNAGVDIFSLFKKFRNKITFIGNLDISFLSYGTPLQIKEYTLKLLNKAKRNNSPLIVSPSQQINASVKPENIKTMIETTKSFIV